MNTLRHSGRSAPGPTGLTWSHSAGGGAWAPSAVQRPGEAPRAASGRFGTPDVKSILVVSGPHTRWKPALLRAVLLAAEQGARVTLLHVLDGPTSREPEESADARIRDTETALRAEVESEVRPLRPRWTGRSTEVTIRIVPGLSLANAVREVRTEDADLLVLSEDSEHPPSDLFLGTIAERALRKGERPVLVVKRTPAGPYRRVLVPVDFSDRSRLALEMAARLASQALIDVLHSCDIRLEQTMRRWGAGEEEIERYRERTIKAARAELERFVRECDPRVMPGAAPARLRRFVKTGRAMMVIPEIARRRRTDLVVLATDGRRGLLPPFILGSITGHVLREVTCDVLAIRPPGIRAAPR